MNDTDLSKDLTRKQIEINGDDTQKHKKQGHNFSTKEVLVLKLVQFKILGTKVQTTASSMVGVHNRSKHSIHDNGVVVTPPAYCQLQHRAKTRLSCWNNKTTQSELDRVQIENNEL